MKRDPFMTQDKDEAQKVKLEWWTAVEKTDPKYTKTFSRSGGFSGTATNATYLVKKATELWGPIGGAWGYDIVEEKYVEGGMMGENSGNTIIHVLRMKFRHPLGAFEHFGQTTFVGKNRNGVFTDEEAPKKSLTDALTKCMAMLGFAADVHLGLYDDSKYVNDRKREFAEEATKEPKQEQQEMTSASPDRDFLVALDTAAATGIEAYRKAWESGTPEQRRSCARQHETLKLVAQKNTDELARKK